MYFQFTVRGVLLGHDQKLLCVFIFNYCFQLENGFGLRCWALVTSIELGVQIIEVYVALKHRNGGKDGSVLWTGLF